MSPTDAASLLELPSGATSEQIETRFLELRRKLEDKIAKAPTPGLQAKYRESLEEITTAFETLTLAADSSSLPVTRKQGTGNKEPGASDSAAGSPLAGGPAAASPRSRLPAPSSTRKSGREFLLVAVIAIALLAGGGWFIMKTRAESAEKTRIAAEAKVEAERRAEESRLAAQQEKDRVAAEAKAEQNRMAAAAVAEKDRLEKLSAQVRITLAEGKLQWEQIEKQEREAERTLSDLKSEERSLRDATEGRRRELSARIAAHADYVQWLSGYLSNHPIKSTQVRTTEFLSSRLVDEAATASAGMAELISNASLATVRRKLAIEAGMYSPIVITAVGTLDGWKLTDAFGRVFIGKSSQTLDQVALGTATLVSQRKGWPDQVQKIIVTAGQTVTATAECRLAEVRITTKPAGARIAINGGPNSTSPATLTVIPGEIILTASLPGYRTATATLSPQTGATLTYHIDLDSAPALTDEEISAFAASLPVSNVASDVPHARWTAQRVELPTNDGRISVCFFTFRPISMTLSSGAPPTQSAWFTWAPMVLGAKATSDQLAMLPGATPGDLAQEGTYVFLNGLLDRTSLQWRRNHPRVDLAANAAFGEAMVAWLRQAGQFHYTGPQGKFDALVYVLVAHRSP